MPQKPTVCPRCGSNNIYRIIGLHEEKEISCSKCGFMGKADKRFTT